MAVFNGTPGNDIYPGTNQNDTIFGQDGNDNLAGIGGNDLIQGDKGSDTLSGGTGNDRLIWNNGDGSDTISGGADTDTVLVNGSTTAGDSFVLGKSGTNAIFNRINLVPFTLRVDTAEKFQISGKGGDDRLKINSLLGTTVEQVSFFGDDGNDTADGGSTNVSLSLQGGLGNDSLKGGSLDDSLEGGKNSDTMIGGAGNDTLEWDNGDGSDTISGGVGFDTVEVNASVTDGDSFVLSKSGTNAIFNRINLVPFTLTTDSSEKFDIEGFAGSDRLVVNDLSGTAVREISFSGGDDNDTLNAGNTNVKIEAKGDLGDDSLKGGSANDLLEGGKGRDTMIGGAGNDTLEWNDGDGSDSISGGVGLDTVDVDGSVSQGDEFVISKSGTKAIFDRVNLIPFKLTVDTVEKFDVNGDSGDDSLVVNNLSGTSVIEVTFTGGSGNDSADGSKTNVRLNFDGGAGNDTLTGGKLNDVFSGGSGRDSFVFNTNRSFNQSDVGIDYITDFASRQDKIVLDKTTFGNIQTSDIGFVNSDAAVATSSQSIVYSSGTGRLFFNQNGAAAGFGTGGQFAILDSDNNLTTPPPVIAALDFSIVA